MGPNTPPIVGQSSTPDLTATTPTIPQTTGTNPQSVLNDPNLQSLLTTANTAATNAANSQAADQTLPELLQQALTAKFTTENPMVAQQGSDLNTYMNALSNTANDTSTYQNGVIISPQAREDLINEQINGAASKLSTDNYILGLQTGGMSNVIQNVAAGHAADTQKLLSAAQLAQQNYTDVLNQLSQKASLAMQANQLAEQQRQFNITNGIDPTTGQPYISEFLNGTTGGANTTGNNGAEGGTLTDQRNAFKAEIAMLQSKGATSAANNLESQWNSTHPGTSLYPQQLDPITQQQIGVNNQIGSTVADIMKTLTKKGSKASVGGLGGIIASLEAGSPLGIFQGLTSKDNQTLQQDFDKLKAVGGRGAVGQLLQNELSSLGGMPSLADNQTTLQKKLNIMLQAVYNDSQTTAINHGYDSYSELPGYTPSMASVTSPDGQTGQIDMLELPQFQAQGGKLTGF